MEYISVTEIAKRWNITERAVRNYLVEGRVEGAFMTGKTWIIPDNAQKPDRKQRKRNMPGTLKKRLKYEKKNRLLNGIYANIQMRSAYFSNHTEGNSLTQDEVESIIKDNVVKNAATDIDEIMEVMNHFRAFNYVIDNMEKPLSVGFLDKLNHILSMNIKKKRADSDGIKADESLKIETILKEYNENEKKEFEDILKLHVEMMCLKQYRHYNGQLSRLVLIRECIRNKYIPFIIDDELKLSYYRGINEWNREKWYLVDTCRIAQDRMANILNEYDILL
ncbi:MAG: cell filamentation protein Fic [Lachnospiraceae bacterium]|nr:cell filamentation protein Fic [Lachnospiraceae bacterium]